MSPPEALVRCLRCGRRLVAGESIAVRLGPVCAGRARLRKTAVARTDWVAWTQIPLFDIAD